MSEQNNEPIIGSNVSTPGAFAFAVVALIFFALVFGETPPQ